MADNYRYIPSLKIAYDGKRAVGNLTGIGNYSRTLIDALSTEYPQHQYMLYAPKTKHNAELERLLERPNVSLHTPGGVWPAIGAMWRSLEMTRDIIADGAHLLHGLSNELPLNITRAPMPSVVTVHDLIWRRVPDNYSYVDRLLYDMKYKASAQAATRVIAISECTKKDLVNDFGISPDKIDVVYQGCSPLYTCRLLPERYADVRSRYSLPERYVVAVGTVEVRKNQMLAVKALRALPDDVKLVIVGRRHKGYGREIDAYIAANRLSERVLWLTGVPNEDLPYLYHMAVFSSYTSRYEGFGLPLVESLSVGTPVIAATGSCLEEAGGSGAVYVDPDDVDAYADAARMLLDDSYRRTRLVEAGSRHIRKFCAPALARDTMHSYIRAIEMFV